MTRLINLNKFNRIKSEVSQSRLYPVNRIKVIS